MRRAGARPRGARLAQTALARLTRSAIRVHRAAEEARAVHAPTALAAIRVVRAGRRSAIGRTRSAAGPRAATGRARATARGPGPAASRASATTRGPRAATRRAGATARGRSSAATGPRIPAEPIGARLTGAAVLRLGARPHAVPVDARIHAALLRRGAGARSRRHVTARPAHAELPIPALRIAGAGRVAASFVAALSGLAVVVRPARRQRLTLAPSTATARMTIRVAGAGPAGAPEGAVRQLSVGVDDGAATRSQEWHGKQAQETKGLQVHGGVVLVGGGAWVHRRVTSIQMPVTRKVIIGRRRARKMIARGPTGN